MSESQVSENKIIHESADERQYVRVNIPGKIKLVKNDEDIWCSLDEISLGGFSFVVSEDQPEFDIGFSSIAFIQFELNALTVQLEVPFSVVKKFDDKYSCKFEELDADKREILRYVIGAYLSGELINLNGVLNVLQRENHITKRKDKDTPARTKSDQLKSVLGTSAFALGAVFVLSILLTKIWSFLFYVESTYAEVGADGYVIKMPENGYVTFLVDENIKEVSHGNPLAVVSTQLMTSLSNPQELKAIADISESELDVLLGSTLIETSINSPCDCFLSWTEMPGDRFAYKDEAFLFLIPKNQSLFIEASFDFEKARYLNLDNPVDVIIPSIGSSYEGKVTTSSIDEEAGVIKTRVLLDADIPADLYKAPVIVNINKSFL